MKVTLILLCVVHIVYTQGQLDIQELGQFSRNEQICIEELQADERKITEALKQLYMPENDPEFNEFMECTWKRDAFIDSNGNIVFDRFKYYVKGAYMDALESLHAVGDAVSELAEAFALDTITYCQKVRGNTPGQTGVKLMNCILGKLYV